MSVAAFCQVLGNVSPDRVRGLHQEGTLNALYVLVWPSYKPPLEDHPANNRAAWKSFSATSGVPMWCWLNASEDQEADAVAIRELDVELNPAGWILDIEGAWTANAKLTRLISAAVGTGKPVRASLAAMTASHYEYDYRTLDKYDVPIDWQSYFDSGEGADPDMAVRELYKASFVIPGWEYRNQLGKTYGWGKVDHFETANGVYNAYQRPGTRDAVFAIGERQWGKVVIDGVLYRDSQVVGKLLGRAKYKNIRVTLDVTRGANDKHTPAQWTAIAASARYPGLGKRPVSVYLMEIVTDPVLRAIAAGAK